jgi:hypothetical protein
LQENAIRKLIAAVAATGACKAVCDEGTLEVLAQRMYNMGRRRVMVAMPVELAHACQFLPRLEMSRDSAIQ